MDTGGNITLWCGRGDRGAVFPLSQGLRPAELLLSAAPLRPLSSSPSASNGPELRPPSETPRMGPTGVVMGRVDEPAAVWGRLRSRAQGSGPWTRESYNALWERVERFDDKVLEGGARP